MLDPVAVAAEGLLAVESIHRRIERGVRLAQFGGHGVGIIEVGQAGGRPGGAGVKHGLG